MKIRTRLIILCAVFFLLFATVVAVFRTIEKEYFTALIISLSFFLIVIVLVMLNRWVMRPLGSIEKALAEGSPIPLGTLDKKKDELGTVAYLIRQFFTQQSLLVDEITSRKKAEEGLRISEERFAKAFRSNPSLMTISKLETGEIIAANDAFLAAVGYGREDVIGRTTLELHLLDTEMRARIVTALKTQGVVRNLDVEIRTRQGDRRQCLFSAERMVLHDEDSMLGVAVDITDRKMAEEKLRKKVGEMERFNRLTIGREVKMVELKAKIEELERKIVNK